jgi:hypothetical protein
MDNYNFLVLISIPGKLCRLMKSFSAEATKSQMFNTTSLLTMGRKVKYLTKSIPGINMETI